MPPDPLAWPPNPDYAFPFLEEEHEEEEELWGEEEEEPKEKVEEELLLRPVRPLLSPPPHGYPDEDGVPRPNFVLVEQKAYFVDRHNATTASCRMNAPLKGSIKVTFCTAPPPLVSYFCVHTTAYTHADFVADPLMVASETDGGLVLLRIIIGEARSDFFRPSCRHLFVYDAGTRRRPPSLKHLPHPGATLEFNGPSLTFVRHCSTKKEGNHARSQQDNSAAGNNYRGPTLRPRHKLRPPPRIVSSSADHHHPHTGSSGSALHPHTGSSGSALHPHTGSSGFALHPHTGSGGSALHPNIAALHPHTASLHTPIDHDCCSDRDYVIVVRDCDFGYKSPSYLWMYDSVTEQWSAKPVEAPAGYGADRGHITTKTITIGEEVAWVDLSRDIIFCDVLAETPKFRVVRLPLPIKALPDPRSVRDISILDGRINYFELIQEIKNDDTTDGWTAVKWSMKLTSPTEAWHLDHKLDSSNISKASKIEDNASQPDLGSLFLGLPNFSFEDSDIVYCLSKIHYQDSKQPAWVIAVDFRKKSVHKAVQYNAIKTVGLSIGYSASRISTYLRVAPGTKQK